MTLPYKSSEDPSNVAVDPMGPPTRLPWDPLDVPLDPWNPLGAPLDAFFGGRGVVCMIKLSFFVNTNQKQLQCLVTLFC